MMKPTQETFELLQTAYDFFNTQLFDSELPQCLILIHRHRGAHGYFWPERFQKTQGGNSESENKLDEIALNPETMNRG
ncbi:MAG: hypothetical protein KC496_08260, partial [Anaerolineae bacterium]|nr:hypothetical protein [Anaerolineae bacterium]